jgi:hypothetical protein
VRVAAAYDLASRLFTGQYRPNGKTFVAHVCGTASIAQLAGATVDETVAALVHAAYDHGDFGDGRMVVTDRKRAEVRAVVGADAEALVAGYAAWPWWDRLSVLRDEGADALAEWERPLAFVRLANELEERVDLGTEYSTGRGAIVYPLDDLVVCAQRLERQTLVELARVVAAANDGQSVPPLLQRPTEDSALVAPRSTGTRLWVRCTGERSVLRRVTRRIPGARDVVDAWRRRRQ